MGAKIYNSDLTKELIDGAKLQQQQGQIPQEIADKVIPVMEVNPKMLWCINKCVSGSLLDGASATLYTCPTDKDTYFVGGLITTAKDVNSTSLFTRITIVPRGSTVAASILITRYEPLTAGQFSMAREFKFPILLERGSAILLTHSTAIASIDSSGEIQLIEVLNPNA